MRLGKLDNDTLDRLILQKFQKTRPESFGPPRIGMDCATLDFGSDLIVTSCDPITSADAARVGALSVHVNCNDAAAGGAEPVGLLVTLLLPPDATEDTVGMIADELAAAAVHAGVDILGGHTEVTDAVTRVVTCTTVLARAPKAGVLPGAKPNDAIVMTKWAGLEGTLLLATDHAERLKAVDPAHLCRAATVASSTLCTNRLSSRESSSVVAISSSVTIEKVFSPGFNSSPGIATSPIPSVKNNPLSEKPSPLTSIRLSQALPS